MSIKATISGRGPFPFDMLRYDACWPATSGDAQIMGNIPDNHHFTATIETWTFQVRTNKSRFEAERWASFGVGLRVEA